MGKFTDPLVVQKVVFKEEKKFWFFWKKMVTQHRWRVYQAFRYHVGFMGSDDVIEIPEGYQTDFASVPKFFWRTFPPDGVYTQAAVVHDFICEHQRDTRSQKGIDLIFLEAMEVLEVKKWKRNIMYQAVKAAQTLKCIKEGRKYSEPNP